MRILPHESRSQSYLSILNLWVLAGATSAFLGCSGAKSRETAAPGHRATATRDTIASRLTDLLRRAASVAPAAPAVWPDFDLRTHVLIVTHQADGPTAIIGDSSPPPPWRPADSRHDVFLLEGPPPDSLAGVRTGLTWKGEARAGTAVSYRGPQTLGTLIHEAFHTHQQRVRTAHPNSFHSGATPNYPDTSINAVAIVIAESRLLGDALAAPTADAMRERTLTALAARAHRCRIVGSQECALERDLERNEGTATYVAAALAGADANRRGLDSLQALLSGFGDLTRLGRWHFYDTGVAWLSLLDRLGPEIWKPTVETAAPDSILASHLKFTSERADSTWTRITATSLWQNARQSAERLVARELALRDSVHRAFWEQRGTLIKVYWKMVESMSIEPRPLPGRVVRGFTVSDSVRGNVSYTIGLAESTIRLDSRANWIKLRDQSASVHGSNPAFVAIVPVAGRTARVGDRLIPLDRETTPVNGSISLQLDHIDALLENASLEVFADSVIVRMR